MQSGAGFLKKAPFTRLLFPLIAGIITQWQLQLTLKIWLLVFSLSLLLLLTLFLLPPFEKFQYTSVNGFFIFIIFFTLGAGIAWNKDIRHNKYWLGNSYRATSAILVSLDEPLSEKTKSYKAIASVQVMVDNHEIFPVRGKIIIYFQKDSSLSQLNYGSRVYFQKPLQLIKNSGNPAGFNYKRYCLFQDISHQVFLRPGEFELLPGKTGSWFKKFLFSTREKVLTMLRKNIKGEKEQGLAEALLIGYKDDLDKNLIQSYSNTGVVHIIAISGLHLGLIYWLLIQIFKPLQKRRTSRWLRPVLIISSLWLFSLLAGGQPSVLRSAVMFTCIVLGENLTRKISIFNTLAFSAFLLLCYNPYWLWDAGFQLSYAAVLSIVIFMKPVYNWFYFKSKLPDYIWKLNAVTIAAQFLTLPFSLYHFHQFPNFFLFSNFIAVPLSSGILLGEILLTAISIFPAAAILLGKILSGMIWLLNTTIEEIDSFPFAVWNGVQVSIIQVILLFIFIAGFGSWLMDKQKAGFKTSLIAMFLFFALRSYSFYQANNQQKIIFYNVPQHLAIDFIDGRNYFFKTDSSLLKDNFLQNFHIKPSRIQLRLKPTEHSAPFFISENYVQFGQQKFIIIDRNFNFENPPRPVRVNALILAYNPKIYLKQLTGIIQPDIIVFDASNPAWKIKYWIKECAALGIPYYNLSEYGAYIVNLK